MYIFIDRILIFAGMLVLVVGVGVFASLLVPAALRRPSLASLCGSRYPRRSC